MYDAEHQTPALERPIRLFACDECKTSHRLGDLNDDMLCEACAPEEEPRGWVPRRHLLEG